MKSWYIYIYIYIFVFQNIQWLLLRCFESVCWVTGRPGRVSILCRNELGWVWVVRSDFWVRLWPGSSSMIRTEKQRNGPSRLTASTCGERLEQVSSSSRHSVLPSSTETWTHVWPWPSTTLGDAPRSNSWRTMSALSCSTARCSAVYVWTTHYTYTDQIRHSSLRLLYESTSASAMLVGWQECHPAS